MGYRLVHKDTRKPVYTGALLKTFRGEPVVLESNEPPRHSGSTGRVYCRDEDGHLNGWYPGVVGCEFETAK
jgi:hypothetical protein